MSNVLDQADRAFLWLRDHLAVAAVLAVAWVAFAAFVLTSRGGSDEPEIPAGAVAVVGQQRVTSAELNHWQSVYSTAAVATGAAKPNTAQTRKAAFELLAGAKWLLEEAREQEVTVTDKQIRASIDAYFQQAGATSEKQKSDLRKQLGTTDADMVFQQRVSLLANKLQERAAAKAPAPTPEQVKATYEKEPGRWATPSTRDIVAVVTANKADAVKARAALEGGATFEKVNADLSGNANLTQNKGVIKGLKNGASGDSVDRAVFAAQLDALTGPVDTGAGWMVFKVQKSTPLPAQSLEQATKAITTNLDNTTKAKAAEAYLKGLRDRWKAKTRCTSLVQNADFCGT